MRESEPASAVAFPSRATAARRPVQAGRAPAACRPTCLAGRWIRRRSCPGRCRHRRRALRAAAARLHRLGRGPDRLGNGGRALVFRPRVGELLVNTVLLVVLRRADLHRAGGGAGLADRAQRPAGRAALGLARRWRRSRCPPSCTAMPGSAWCPGCTALSAGVLVSVLAYFPFLYLPVAAQLRRLDPALEDAASSLGLGPWRVFLRVVLPQLRLAICGGSLLVGLHLLAEYGLYAMIRFDTFTTAIVDQFQSAYNGPAANMLAGVLVLCCLAAAGARGPRPRAGALCARRRRRRARPRRAGASAAGAVPAFSFRLRRALLALGVPARHARRAGSSAAAPASGALDGIGAALGQTLALAVRRRGPDDRSRRCRWPGCRCARRAALQRALEAAHYYRRLAARRRRRAGAGHDHGARRAAALPDRDDAASRLCADVPAARAVGLRASIAQAPVELERAAMALGRIAGSGGAVDHDAPGGARRRRQHGAGRARHHQRADRDPDAGAQRHAHAGDGILVAERARSTMRPRPPMPVMMIVLSLPLTCLLYAQSRRVAGR